MSLLRSVSVYLEEEKKTVLGNVTNHPPGNSASHPKRPESLLTLVWEPWTWQVWWGLSFWSQCIPLTVTIFLEARIRYARTMELLPVYNLKDLVLHTVLSSGSWLIDRCIGAVSPDAPRPWFNGSFVPHIKSWEPRNLTKVPDGPQA